MMYNRIKNKINKINTNNKKYNKNIQNKYFRNSNKKYKNMNNNKIL